MSDGPSKTHENDAKAVAVVENTSASAVARQTIGPPPAPKGGLSPEALEELLTRLPAPSRPRLFKAWRKTVARLFPLGGSSRHNSITLFHSGDDAFQTILDAIENAKVRVWMETYIFAPDALGTRVRDALVRAAKRGVEVVLLYDQWGSSDIDDTFFAPLKDAGGEVVVFNPIAFAKPFRLWLRLRNRDHAPVHFRDHRKIVIVDDDTGFAGGMNISEDYAGPQLGNGRFRDTHARLMGPAVSDLAKVFLDSLREATGKLRINPVRPKSDVGPSFVQVLGSNVRRRRRHIQRSVRQTVRRSVEHCYVTSPYFVPPRRLIRAMLAAAKRGVDVRVMTAGLSDVPLARIASSYLYPRLIRGGVRIYELQKRTLHAKTTTIDGVYATVGSFNLDFWSHRRLLEVNVAFLDIDLAENLKVQFHEDLKEAEEIKIEALDRRSFFTRVVAWLAYRTMRL